MRAFTASNKCKAVSFDVFENILYQKLPEIPYCSIIVELPGKYLRSCAFCFDEALTQDGLDWGVPKKTTGFLRLNAPPEKISAL